MMRIKTLLMLLMLCLPACANDSQICVDMPEVDPDVAQITKNGN